MPIVEYRIVAGRHDDVDVAALLNRSCELLAEVLEAPLDRVRAVAHDIPPARFSVGGTLISDGADEAPYFTFFLLDGRTEEQRARLLAGFTDLIVECLGTPRELVRGGIWIVAPEDWAIAGVPAATARRDEVAARQAATQRAR